MALKSVFDIDVNDSKFQRFQALFEKYQKALAKTPGMWKDVDKAAGKVGSQFEKIAAALMAQNQLTNEIQEGMVSHNRQLSRSEQMWTSVSKSTKSISGSLLSATRSLLSWTGILTGVGGLLSLFSFAGLERLGSNAANQRRSSMGLGMSAGEQRAFQVNFSRAVNPDAYLDWINQIETDPTKAWSAYALGAPPTGNTEKDAVRLLQALRSKAQATPTSQLGLLQQQYGYSGSVDDLRRLKTMSSGEFGQLLAGNQRDISGLGINDSTLKKWQDFTTTMERAGAQISKVFINGLVPLTGPIEHLATGFTHFLGILMRKDGIVEEGINKLAGWLDGFAGKLDSAEWESTFTRFTASIGDAADLIHTLAHPYDTAVNWTSGKMSGLSQWLAPDPGIVTSSKAEYSKYLGRLESKYNLPSGLLGQVWQKESGSALYPTKSISRAGAKGAFQFMPETAAQYGVNPMDPLSSANGAAQYLFDLEKKYGGDTRKALAAYNWGPGNVDQSLAGTLPGHPRGWVPKETSDYIGGGNLLQAKPPGVSIHVYNNTGGSAIVSASQLAH